MEPTLQQIINNAADAADDFLNGVSSMTEARPAIREFLAQNHPKLPKPAVEQVVAGVLSILDDEGFFEGRSDDGAWGDEGSGEDSNE